MQQAAPEALDINLETQEVHDLYGIGVKEVITLLNSV